MTTARREKKDLQKDAASTETTSSPLTDSDIALLETSLMLFCQSLITKKEEALKALPVSPSSSGWGWKRSPDKSKLPTVFDFNQLTHERADEKEGHIKPEKAYNKTIGYLNEVITSLQALRKALPAKQTAEEQLTNPLSKEESFFIPEEKSSVISHRLDGFNESLESAPISTQLDMLAEKLALVLKSSKIRKTPQDKLTKFSTDIDQIASNFQQPFSTEDSKGWPADLMKKVSDFVENYKTSSGVFAKVLSIDRLLDKYLALAQAVDLRVVQSQKSKKKVVIPNLPYELPRTLLSNLNGKSINNDQLNQELLQTIAALEKIEIPKDNPYRQYLLDKRSKIRASFLKAHNIVLDKLSADSEKAKDAVASPSAISLSAALQEAPVLDAKVSSEAKLEELTPAQQEKVKAAPARAVSASAAPDEKATREAKASSEAKLKKFRSQVRDLRDGLIDRLLEVREKKQPFATKAYYQEMLFFDHPKPEEDLDEELDILAALSAAEAASARAPEESADDAKDSDKPVLDPYEVTFCPLISFLNRLDKAVENLISYQGRVAYLKVAGIDDLFAGSAEGQKYYQLAQENFISMALTWSRHWVGAEKNCPTTRADATGVRFYTMKGEPTVEDIWRVKQGQEVILSNQDDAYVLHVRDGKDQHLSIPFKEPDTRRYGSIEMVDGVEVYKAKTLPKDHRLPESFQGMTFKVKAEISDPVQISDLHRVLRDFNSVLEEKVEGVRIAEYAPQIARDYVPSDVLQALTKGVLAEFSRFEARARKRLKSEYSPAGEMGTLSAFLDEKSGHARAGLETVQSVCDQDKAQYNTVKGKLLGDLLNAQRAEHALKQYMLVGQVLQDQLHEIQTAEKTVKRVTMMYPSLTFSYASKLDYPKSHSLPINFDTLPAKATAAQLAEAIKDLKSIGGLMNGIDLVVKEIQAVNVKDGNVFEESLVDFRSQLLFQFAQAKQTLQSLLKPEASQSVSGRARGWFSRSGKGEAKQGRAAASASSASASSETTTPPVAVSAVAAGPAAGLMPAPSPATVKPHGGDGRDDESVVGEPPVASPLSDNPMG